MGPVRALSCLRLADLVGARPSKPPLRGAVGGPGVLRDAHCAYRACLEGTSLCVLLSPADPEALWLMQGWLFQHQPDFWQPAQVRGPAARRAPWQDDRSRPLC